MPSDWIQISDTFGSGDATITITASTLSELVERSTQLKVMGYGGKIKRVNVVQEASDLYVTGITINNLTWVVDIPSIGGIANKNNCSYSVIATYNNGATSDVTSSTNITGSRTVSSTTATTRQSVGSLTLTASYGNFTNYASVTMYQSAFEPIITLSPSTISFGPSGGTATINVTSNVCWECSVSGDTPPTPSSGSVIYYTSTNGNVITPTFSGIEVFGANIVSNTYTEGRGVITFDGNVTTIGENAFRSQRINSIIIPNTVTEIGYQAFYLSYLSAVTIPENVTLISGYSFFYCTEMTSITCLSTTPPTIRGNPFGYTNDCPIYVPAASVETYKAASGWSSYASRIQAIP